MYEQLRSCDRCKVATQVKQEYNTAERWSNIVVAEQLVGRQVKRYYDLCPGCREVLENSFMHMKPTVVQP